MIFYLKKIEHTVINRDFQSVMFYTELNSKMDYTRENLRWNSWGAYGQDFFKVGQMQEILKFLSVELQISEIRKTPYSRSGRNHSS